MMFGFNAPNNILPRNTRSKHPLEIVNEVFNAIEWKSDFILDIIEQTVMLY